jgi:hypothetical protein
VALPSTQKYEPVIVITKSGAPAVCLLGLNSVIVGTKAGGCAEPKPEKRDPKPATANNHCEINRFKSVSIW